jgi:quercetin dioxygenase-like cupin family protein
MSELAESNISLVNDVFIKEMVFVKKGWIAQTHAHVYDHQTLLAAGALRVTVDGVSEEWRAPKVLIIAAGKLHRLEALEDGTVAYCVHAVKGGDTIDEAEPLVQGQENVALTNLA